MSRLLRLRGLILAVAALLAVCLGGCPGRQRPTGPSPSERRGPVPRPVVGSGQDRITISVYFADANAAALVPVKRTVRSDPATAAGDALQALIEGPLPDEGAEGIMPKGAAVDRVSLDDATARVRFSDAFYDNFPGAGAFGNLCVYAIVNTLTSIPGIDEVIVQVPGSGRLLGEIDVSEPLQRNDELVAASS